MASHGTPWTYDARVPVMFFGPALLKSGRRPEKAEPADIAPTLAYLLGVPPPSGSEGRILWEIFR